MSDIIYYVTCGLLSITVLLGIYLMSKVKTAALGNILSACSMLVAVLLTLYKYKIFHLTFISKVDAENSMQLHQYTLLTDGYMWIGLLIGAIIGLLLVAKVKMITMPETVALLNGLGGVASALAAFLTLLAIDHGRTDSSLFVLITSGIALGVGSFTFSGSLIATGKLHKILPQKPTVFPLHSLFTLFFLMAMMACMVLLPISLPSISLLLLTILLFSMSLLFGIFFAIRVGGADMPITISLLNSTSGVAAAIAGMAIKDLLLVSVGGIVGASGLLLTRIMCKAMNRSLLAILFHRVKKGKAPVSQTNPEAPPTKEETNLQHADPSQIKEWVDSSNSIILIPGYGMALAQAQNGIKQLSNKLEELGKEVRFAIHPVAGRMPGHMNVLLGDVNIPYEKLYEMEAINDDFEKTDLAIVVGASDVINPAANTAKDTPIYGMPILSVEKAKRVIICNFDLKPGYAGVENPLYQPHPQRMLLLGDAKESLKTILEKLES